MKVLITTLTFIFISFSVNAKDTFYDCKPFPWQLKVEDTFLGEKKLFIRVEGSWRKMCKGKDVIKITNDSFKCSYHRDDLTSEFTTVAPDSYVLDEKFKTLTFRYFNNAKKIYNCHIQ